jgi:hypothetical protein
MPCRHGIRGRRWIRPLVELHAWSIWPHTEIVPAKGGGVVRTAQLNDNPFISLSSTQRQACDDQSKASNLWYLRHWLYGVRLARSTRALPELLPGNSEIPPKL